MTSVHWATNIDGIGNSFGFSVHDRMSRAAAVAAGVALDPGADIVVHVGSPLIMRRGTPCPACEGKGKGIAAECPICGGAGRVGAATDARTHVLYTAWESTVMPARFAEHCRMADAIIVPARFLVPVMQRYAPDARIYHCPEGVDVDQFPFHDRELPRIVGNPVRFLYLGASSSRKGVQWLSCIWEVFTRHLRQIGADPRSCELYVKTTSTRDRQEVRRPADTNIVFDTRILPREKLAEIYHSAHVFLFPSHGEGFGLTLAEAMCTGLPCIFTNWSSLPDLADAACGFPVGYELQTMPLQPGMVDARREPPKDLCCDAPLAVPDATEFLDAMMFALTNYRNAYERGVRAAVRIRERFQWGHCGMRLREIFEQEQALREAA